MLLTSTYYLSLLLVILLSLFQISRQLMEQAATIAAAREDTSEAALSSWEKAVQKCALEKVEKARMEMKKHRISLAESVAESVPGAGTGVKGMTWDTVDVIEPFGFDEPDAFSIHCQGWPI
jgi:hypothetical protein